MKKSFFTVLFVLTLFLSASFAVSAADMGNIEVLNGAGKVVATYEVATDNTDSETEGDIQKALNYCRDNASENNIHTICLPEGEYTVTTTFNIYSNTVIDFGGSVVYRGEKGGSIMRFGAGTQVSYGYDGYRNITIRNGIFDAQRIGSSSLLRFAHAYNVEISDIVFRNTLDVKHLLTFAACEKVRILDCEFLDMDIEKMGSSNNCEAIQMDVLKEEYFVYPAYDETPIKDVEISGCTFRNVPRGVGTHTGIAGYYFDKMVIKNNTFTNVAGYAIKGVNYINCEIYDNVITDCGSGICCATVPHEELGNFYAPFNKNDTIVKNFNTKIYNNTISIESKGHNVTAYGIRVHGENIVNFRDRDGVMFTGDCRISGVTVENNTITTSVDEVSVFGIHVKGADGKVTDGESDVKIRKNKITVTNNKTSENRIYGIRVEHSENVDINSNTINDTNKGEKNLKIGVITENSKGIVINANTIKNAISYGIRTETTDDSVIKKNKISEMGGTGIYVYDESAGNFVTSNTVKSCPENGIFVYECGACEVKYNKVSSSGECGILVKRATDALVQSNTVSGSKTIGIYILKSEIGNVSYNKVSSSGMDGISYRESVAANLKSNTISDSKETGIHLNQSTLTSVASNTVTSAGTEGIYLERSTVDSIKSNTLTECKANGIYVKKSTAKKITSNSIPSPGTDGIYLKESKSDSVKSNTISSSKTNGIHAKDSTVKYIDSNTVSSAGTEGIYLDETTVTDVKNNTVTKSKANGLYVKKSTAKKITSNKITSPGTQGMYLKESKSDEIISNSVSKSKTNGIYIKGSTAKKIDSNTVSSAGAEAVYLERSTSDSVKSNTIKSSKRNSLYFRISTVKKIESNKISSPGEQGIYLNEGKSEDIKSNKITNSGATAVYIKKSTADNISSNKIDTSASHGLYLNGSKVKNIKSNKLYTVTASGINLSDTVTTNLSSNKIYYGSNTNIFIAGTSKVTTVSSNYICGGKATGICVTKKASAGTITKNNIDLVSSSADGISVDSKATAGKIKGNSINTKTAETSKDLKVKCRYGIMINSPECKISEISGNTVNSCSKSGIYVAKNKDGKVKITGNTVTKAAYGISYAKNKAVVKDNTFKSCSKKKTQVIK